MSRECGIRNAEFGMKNPELRPEASPSASSARVLAERLLRSTVACLVFCLMPTSAFLPSALSCLYSAFRIPHWSDGGPSGDEPAGHRHLVGDAGERGAGDVLGDAGQLE